MNKFLYPSNDQILINYTDFEFTTQALTDAINAIATGLVANQTIYIISGCTLSQVGSNVVLTSGTLYVNGEIFTVDSQTFNNLSLSTVQAYYFNMVSSFDTTGDKLQASNGAIFHSKSVRKANLAPTFGYYPLGDPNYGSIFVNIPYSGVVTILTVLEEVQSNSLTKGATFLPSQVIETDVNSNIITEVKKTAFNQDFDSSGISTLVARADHSHTNYVKTTTLPTYNTPELLFAAHYEKATPTAPTIYVQSSRLNYTSTSNDSTGLYTLSINYTTPYMCNVISTDADTNIYYATVHKSATSIVLNFTDSSSNHNSSFDIMVYGF